MMAESTRRGVPEATVGRLPGYLRALTALADRGRASVSSDELAELTGVRGAQVRKDLSSLGSHGVRGVGYDVTRLSDQIAAELGLLEERPVVIVGELTTATMMPALLRPTGRSTGTRAPVSSRSCSTTVPPSPAIIDCSS